MGRLESKVAIVTGAAMGIGGEDARLFTKEGAKVVIADIKETEGKKVAEDIKNDGGEAVFIKLDVTKEGDWKELMDTVPESVSDIGQLPNQNIIERMQNNVVTLIETVRQLVKEALDTLDSFEADNSSFNSIKKDWDNKHDEFQKEYKNAKEQSSTHEALLTRLAELENQLKELRTDLSSKKAELRKVSNPERRFRILIIDVRRIAVGRHLAPRGGRRDDVDRHLGGPGKLPLGPSHGVRPARTLG